MVNAIFILVIGLGAAFLLGFLRDKRKLAYVVTLAALVSMAWIAARWLLFFAVDGGARTEIFTAGTLPPFAINLHLGIAEAALMLLVILCGLFSAIYMQNTLMRLGRRMMSVLLVFVMSLCGIILTRDVFNLFVFFELAVIATAGLILLCEDKRTFAAGFKYLIISQIVSILLLVGIIFAYHASGSLNIDDMAAMSSGTLKGVGSLAFFLMLMAIMTEAKPFPANGWALDIYESAHPAFSALFSAAMAGAAAVYAIDKLLLIGASQWLPVVTAIGLLSFVAANLLALVQTNDRRTLGYSSVGQVGLILVVIGQRDILGEHYLYIVGGILLSHAVAKAGLYWLSGLLSQRKLTDWSALRGHPLLIFAFVSFVAMLTGLPPFPSFYAKWDLVMLLAAENRLWILALILIATLLEAGYLFRWFGYIIKREKETDKQILSLASHKLAVVLSTAVISWGLAYLWGELSAHGNLLYALPLLFALSFLLLDQLPARIKNSLSIAGMVAYFMVSYPTYDPLQLIFGAIFLLGSSVILLASYHVSGRRVGFYPSALLMFAGLTLLIVAKDAFHFFAAWEFLTIGSYFLILRGKHSEPHALSYVIFSLGGAFLILAGFALAAQGISPFPLESLAQVAKPIAPWVFLLLAIGFMTKTAVIGLHIWLPGAHAEAETDVSPMVSGILLKAGLFGLMVLLMNMGKQSLYGVELTYVMLWMGALSAFLGNLMAVFQEDAKRLLAYSSIGQMGYALFGLALMNQLGWLMALMFVINHYIYKSMLFLSIGGIAKRTGTRDMYKMGGLIALMPLSFIAVLIGIIAVSGVPPLSGFGGRWIFYNAILESEYRLPMMLIFISGPIAFLYLFRLIHTIFLGQLKDEHRQIKEAPFWILLPQMIYVVALMIFAVVPGLAMRHVDAYLSPFFEGQGLNWEGFTITSHYGYWSPVSIMIVVAVIFATLFAWLLFVNRKAQKVKQFNIVYSAERPFRPETTHFAWNFFAPYRKALGFLMQPYVTRFWETMMDLLHSIADLSRRFYTGNGQTYGIQLLAFVVIVYLFKMEF
ncbi:MAG: NADH-quinone oxidoreductase subunit F [gamma proteobacterium symbiont of Taylorina sp.]|nr:NADH-quinone oxidoreductase subunit F [gamma proteobacterium symbiont of Taylorina sp.]